MVACGQVKQHAPTLTSKAETVCKGSERKAAQRVALCCHKGNPRVRPYNGSVLILNDTQLGWESAGAAH